jgi:hypothetical protein
VEGPPSKQRQRRQEPGSVTVRNKLSCYMKPQSDAFNSVLENSMVHLPYAATMLGSRRTRMKTQELL